MKKLLFLLVVLLLFPITVFAKTPNQEETIKVIKSISNVTVIDGVTIESTDVDDQNVIFTINGNAIYIPYQFSDNKFSFKGGRLLLDSNNQVVSSADLKQATQNLLLQKYLSAWNGELPNTYIGTNDFADIFKALLGSP